MTPEEKLDRIYQLASNLSVQSEENSDIQKEIMETCEE